MDSLFETLNNLSKQAKIYEINDGCNVITDKLDFTTKEDLDILKQKINELKDTKNPIVGVIKSIAGTEYENVLNSIISDAEKIYNDNQKAKSEEKPVIKENRPSDKISDELQRQIAKLTSDYVNEVIIPNFTNITPEQTMSIYTSLFEFACWIYKR
jgi:hypothetical protein